MISLTDIQFGREQIVSIARTVSAWLGYLYEVSETKHLVAESSVRYPITGYLERRSDLEVQMEYKIPELPYRRYDFYWYKTTSPDSFCALEVKYQRDESIKKQDIFSDLLRLAISKKDGCHCYFMLCGTEQDVNNKILKQCEEDAIDKRSMTVSQRQSQRKADHDMSRWFYIRKNKFDLREKTVKITSKDKFLAKFKEDYGLDKLKRISFKTKLQIPAETNMKSFVAVWEIYNVVISGEI